MVEIIDAAVAISFARCCASPTGNIGGGGFGSLVIRTKILFIPLIIVNRLRKSYESMFIKTAMIKPCNQSFLGSGTPGSVHGLYEAHKRFGNLSWSRLVNPAIKLALNGFIVTKTLADSLKSNAQKLSATPDGQKIFLKVINLFQKVMY